MFNHCFLPKREAQKLAFAHFNNLKQNFRWRPQFTDQRQQISHLFSKDIKRVHSVKNTVLRTSHGFAKLTPFTRHQKQIKYSKKNLICQQAVWYRLCVFSQNYRENAVRNAKSGIFKEKTLSSFISGQNFSTITVSDLFYSHKKYG